MSDFVKKEFDFSEYKAFFAFSNTQLDKALDRLGIEKGTKLVSLWGGLIAMKSNYEDMIKAMNTHYEGERVRRIKEVGMDGIIKYELINHESYYTGDISSACDALEGYGFTNEDILKVYNREKEFNLDY